MANSTATARSKKVTKPRPDFPLFPPASHRWAKKVRGRLVYFGSTKRDPKGVEALKLWLDQKDDLLAGRTPTVKRDGPTLADLANRFLTVQEQRYKAGEIVFRTFDERLKTCKWLVQFFGRRRLVVDLRVSDFESLKAHIDGRFGVHRRTNEIGRIRSLFKYALEADLIEHTIKFGPTFKKPAKKVVRQHKQKQTRKNYYADEIRLILESAPQPLKAMTLLAIIGGMGNHDVGTITESAVDLETGWVDFPRPKTAVERRFPLWSETVAAIKEAIAERPKPAGAKYSELLFLTPEGKAWATDKQASTVSKHFRDLLIELGIHRHGVSFYGLRHSFETVAGDCRDQVAVDMVMGHADDSMADNYRHGIDDQRLIDVTQHVHKWLFGNRKPR